MKKLLLAFALVLPVTSLSARPMTPDDLVMLDRIVEHQVSPDGKWIVYALRSTDLEANRGRTDLWLTTADRPSTPRQLTRDPAADSAPRFAPDGRSIYFLSTRSGSQQVWQLELDGGESRQITSLPLDVGSFLVAPDGQSFAVSLEVFVDCADLKCTTDRLEAKKVGTGLLYDRLFIRHWDTWKDGRRSHLFIVKADGSGTPVDLTAGLDADVPSKPFGDVEEWAFHPDGSAIVFTGRDMGTAEAWSTNQDIMTAPVDGSAKVKKLTTSAATDTQPAFSPDGKTLAYLAMARPGYEADRLQIMLRDWESGVERKLAPTWDRSPDSLVFSADGKVLFVTATDIGHVGLFAIDVASGAVKTLKRDGHVRSPRLVGDRLIYGRDSYGGPVDLYSVAADGNGDETRLTEVNRARLAEVELGAYEQFSFKGAQNETVYGWIVKPAGHIAGQKLPIAFLIHGGPQGSWRSEWSYRWNPQAYAGAGFGVVMIDFHGSIGYGQAFTDAINQDWGGKPLQDLQLGLKAAIAKVNDLDGTRACALGASYGGYMINWIAGNWPTGFDCLVNHDGVFNTEGMYYSTEELWFPEFENGGPAFKNRAAYQKHNPINHIDKWRTPMMVIHGAKDYRVLDTEGISTFTALQRQGIPSQLLYFPDENHWVLKPANSLQWHRTVLDWIKRWTAQ